MSSGIFYPGAGSDDGWDQAAGGGFDNSGSYWSHDGSRDGFCRFPGVNISPGSTITAAFLRVTIFSNSYVLNSIAAYDFSDVDNASAPANSAAVQALAGTGNTVNWELDVVLAGQVFDSPSLIVPLQAIIDRPGWTEDNAVLLFSVPFPSTSFKAFCAIEYSSGTKKAELHVEWSSLADVIAGDVGSTGVFASIRLRDAISGAGGSTALFTGALLDGHLDEGIGTNAVFSHEGSIYNSPHIESESGQHGVFSALRLRDDLTANEGTHAAFSKTLWRYGTFTNGSGTHAAFEAFNFSAWMRANGNLFTRRYFLTLTGWQNGTTDIVLPMESFQARMRQGEPSYLSCVIPNTDYAAAINLRPNGWLILEMAAYVEGVETLREELLRTFLEGIGVDSGARSGSITLDGHGVKTYGASVIALEGVTYYRIDHGVDTYRCAYPDFYLKPGSIALYNGNAITVRRIDLLVGPSDSSMEVSDG